MIPFTEYFLTCHGMYIQIECTDSKIGVLCGKRDSVLFDNCSCKTSCADKMHSARKTFV